MQFEEGHTVGIDLGTTFSTLAYLDAEGNPVPVENEDEDVETTVADGLAPASRLSVEGLEPGGTYLLQLYDTAGDDRVDGSARFGMTPVGNR